MINQENDYKKGRGAQINSDNPFLKNRLVDEHIEGIDEPILSHESKTQFFFEQAKKIINKVESDDLGMNYSMNPYQGCEHGCIYCYARNTHQYWGYSAGLDFETKIIVKKNAPKLLIDAFENPKWVCSPIMFSGNTDCYQPLERKFQITRQLLEICLRYRNPVSLITKNSLLLRDLELVKEMASMNLVHVSVSINSLQEAVRLKLEPRTTTIKQRLAMIEKLSAAQVPVNVMVAPIIPGLTDHEIPEILKVVSNAGANYAQYTVARLNGALGTLFTDWVNKAYPDRASKILNLIAEVHGGQLNDSRFRIRMRGEGPTAAAIGKIFSVYRKKYFKHDLPNLDCSQFRNGYSNQLNLFSS